MGVLAFLVFATAFVVGLVTEFKQALWIAGLYGALFIWAIVVYSLNQVRVEQDKVVVFSRKSWHYKLYKWLCPIYSSEPKSECEYWARVFHGIFVETWAFYAVCLFAFICVFIFTCIGWLLGKSPNWRWFNPSGGGEEGVFLPGRQPWHWIRPLVLALIVVTVTGYSMREELLSIFTQALPYLFYGLPGLAATGVVVLLFIKVLYPLLSYLVMRSKGVCRKVEFVD